MIPSGNGNAATREPALNLPFTDQRGGLKMMGALLIAVGLLGGCLGIASQAMMLSPQAAAAAGGAPASTRQVVAALVVMALTAGLFVTLGTASVRLRRWARPLVVGLTATWVLVGAAKVASVIAFGPAVQRALAGSAPATAPTTGAGGFVVAAVMLFMIMVLLPGGFMYFYTRDGVRQTLEHFDPTPAWTDRVPVPVIALGFWLVLGALRALSATAWGMFPAFGWQVHGGSAVAAWVAVSLAFALLAWGVTGLKPVAWWTAVVVALLNLGSTVATISRLGLAEFHRHSASPTARIDATQWLAQDLMYSAVLLAYLIWVRRYFGVMRAPGVLAVKSTLD